jgi:hypothetical protein
MLGSLGSIAAQVGAIDVRIVDSGDTLFGSSRVPALTAVKCARLCDVTSTCVPHMGQNRQYMTFPLSAMNGNSLSSSRRRCHKRAVNEAVSKVSPLWLGYV